MTFFKRLWRLIARSIVVLTVFALAMVTTAAGAGLWYAAHVPSPLYKWQDAHPYWIFTACMLMLICPWWALLAVLFRKLNWLRTPAEMKMKSSHRVCKMRADKACL